MFIRTYLYISFLHQTHDHTKFFRPLSFLKGLRNLLLVGTDTKKGISYSSFEFFYNKSFHSSYFRPATYIFLDRSITNDCMTCCIIKHTLYVMAETEDEKSRAKEAVKQKDSLIISTPSLFISDWMLFTTRCCSSIGSDEKWSFIFKRFFEITKWTPRSHNVFVKSETNRHDGLRSFFRYYYTILCFNGDNDRVAHKNVCTQLFILIYIESKRVHTWVGYSRWTFFMLKKINKHIKIYIRIHRDRSTIFRPIYLFKMKTPLLALCDCVVRLSWSYRRHEVTW